MSNFAIIENTKVVNIVVAEDAFAAEQGWIAVSENTQPSIGWDYVDGQFVNNIPPPAVVVPEVTKEQLLAQLQAIQAQLTNIP